METKIKFKRVLFGPMVFCFFCSQVEYLVIWIFIYLILWIRSTGPAQWFFVWTVIVRNMLKSHKIIQDSVYVTSSSSISYCSNSEYWSQKFAQSGNIHSITLDVERQSAQKFPFLLFLCKLGKGRCVYTQ